MFNFFNRKSGLAANPALDGHRTNPDQSAVLAYFMSGHFLVESSEGTIRDLHYVVDMTGSPAKKFGHSLVSDTALLYTLDLPFNTHTHIVCLSKDSALDRAPFESYLGSIQMQPKSQAGIFDEYFDLYMPPSQDFQVHYVLDEDAMQYVVDYSRAHFWEIHDDKLYFAITDHDKVADNFIEAGADFVDAVRPALLAADPGGLKLYHYTPYGEYVGTKPACPDCRLQLKFISKYDKPFLICPSGHGILFTKNDLDSLTSHLLEFPLDATSAQPNDQIICPNCKHMMNPEMYLTGALRIQTCEHCLYRWLDASEVAKFAGIQP